MIEQEPKPMSLSPCSGRAAITQRLIPFGPSPLMNQAKQERSYEEEYMAR
jgi:hypothetical protein